MTDDLREQMAIRDAITQDIASEALEQVDRAYPIQRPTSLNDPPARPQPTAPPQQQAAAPVAQPQGTPQSQPQVGQPDPGKRYAGKYISVEELEKGAMHQQTLITNLQRELSALRSTPTNVPASQSPAARANPVTLGVERLAKLKTAFEEGREFPVQELTEAVTEIVDNVVTQREAPRTAQAQAVAYMQVNHPRFFDFQGEVASHVKANPTLEAVVSREISRGNYEGAMETAWSNFALSAGVDVHQRMNANNEVLNQEVERARQDAGLVSTQAGGVHQAQPDSRFISQERLEQLGDMSRAGYNMPLAREVFGFNLPDDVFGTQP